MKSCQFFVRMLVLGFFCLCSGACVRDLRDAMDILLFTENEAQQLNLDSQNEKERNDYANRWLLASRSGGGPLIIMEKPSLIPENPVAMIETQSPTPLTIRFEMNPRTGSPVDMQSLEVKGKKGMFSKSLTQTLRPFIKGTRIDGEQIKIPKGEFHIEISIADKNGNQTVENYLVKVK